MEGVALDRGTYNQGISDLIRVVEDGKRTN